MRRNKRSWKSLSIGLISLIGLLYISITISPQTIISLGILHLSILFPFFLLLFLSIFGLIDFLFRSRLHSLLCALLVCSYLLFRFFHLTHPFFAFILLALFLTLELLFARPKQ